MKIVNESSLSNSKLSNLPYSGGCLEDVIKTELNNKNEFTLLNCNSKEYQEPIASYTSSAKYIPKRATHTKTQVTSKKHPFIIDYTPKNKISYSKKDLYKENVNSFEFIVKGKKYNDHFLTMSIEDNFDLNYQDDSRLMTLPVNQTEREEMFTISNGTTGRSTNTYKSKKESKSNNNNTFPLYTTPSLREKPKQLKTPKQKYIKSNHNKNHFICTSKNMLSSCNNNTMRDSCDITSKTEKKIYTNKNSTPSEYRNTFFKKHSMIYHNLNNKDVY